MTSKNLGLVELIAIALGGMVGGGIFTILGISVSLIGPYTPIAITIGGILAALAAYSYAKLGVYYKDEGATYAFYKKTYPNSDFKKSLIGWWVIFGYISTLSLYAYTFASYSLSSTSYADNEFMRKFVSGGIILAFTLVNIWSVKGMGKIEDLMVYTKIIILIIISFTLINHHNTSLPVLFTNQDNTSLLSILIVASLTFVAYEGFQLVINAVNEMESPEKNIPRAIYSAIFLAVLIYVVISLGAILAIPFNEIIENKEYALAAGAEKALGHYGRGLVILGALLATSSAINGTLFGASRQMAAIARDGFFPYALAKKVNNSPVASIIMMATLAFLLILAGSLQMILEFGSITFLIVSLLMAIANHHLRAKTNSSSSITVSAIVGLTIGTTLILYFNFVHHIEQLYFIGTLYIILTVCAYVFSKNKTQNISTSSRH